MMKKAAALTVIEVAEEAVTILLTWEPNSKLKNCLEDCLQLIQEAKLIIKSLKK